MTNTSYTSISCEERDAHLLDPRTGRTAGIWKPYSSLTDMGGVFGAPTMDTTWGFMQMRVRDVRWLSWELGDKDIAPCEHYFWIETEAQDD